MEFFPYLDLQGNIVDGAYIRLLPFCIKKCSSDKCKKYYERLKEAGIGGYCCPYGLASYVYISPIGKVILTGLRIRGIYDKKQSKIVASQEHVYNPVIDVEVCNLVAQQIVESMCEKNTIEAIEDLLHETRSLNGQIKNAIDFLWETDTNEDNIDCEALIETLKNVHVSSYMISNRFSYFDSVLNPALSIGSPYSAVIFKKFDKMRKLLKGYQRKNVWIVLKSPNQSNYRYNIYPTFETLLFIIMENAIKYSPNNNPVDVIFSEDEYVLDVVIQSIGPYCDENEILHLCDKGFRSENAQIIENRGQGFGLNFAKKICDEHNIDLEFQSKYSYKDHGVKYGNFTVTLHFDIRRQEEN